MPAGMTIGGGGGAGSGAAAEADIVPGSAGLGAGLAVGGAVAGAAKEANTPDGAGVCVAAAGAAVELPPWLADADSFALSPVEVLLLHAEKNKRRLTASARQSL